MSRNKALAALLAALLTIAPCAFAESVNIIPDEMILSNTVNYEIHTAELGSYEQTYSNTGNEYYPYTCHVRPEVDGAKFVEYTVEKGETVKKGDVLARFSLEVDEVRLTELQLTVEQILDDIERQTELRVEEITEMREMLPEIEDKYEYQLQALRIERAQLELERYVYEQKLAMSKAEEEIAEIEAEQEGALLIAPADGTVTRTTLMRAGDRVYQSEALVTLLRTDGKMLVFENTGGYFRYGMEVSIEIGTGKNLRTLSGRIVGEDGHVPEAQRTGMAYVEFEDDGEDIFAAKIRAKGVYLENVMILPRKAVELESGSYYVTKLQDGVARKRYVNCIVKPGQQIWILQGIEAGEEIIVD